MDVLQARLDVVAIATAHLGAREIPQGSNAGPFVDQVLAYVGLGPGNPWCAAFACWVLGKAGVPNPKTGSTGAFHHWGVEHGALVAKPQKGDIGCLIDPTSPTGFAHTVICVGGPTALFPATIEGNELDQVMRRFRALRSCIWLTPYRLGS